MEKILQKIKNQLIFSPIIINKKYLKKRNNIVICGMGGSHLAGDLLKILRPNLNIYIHSNYDLPNIKLKDKLIIFISYSGETKETLSGFKKALDKKLNISIITSRGELLKLAVDKNIPYIKIPEDTPARFAIVYIIKSLFKFLNDNKGLREIKKIKNFFNYKKFLFIGKKIANQLKDKIPVIYSSYENFPLAYIWKIKFNETSKIPAFCNYLPELTHNEIQGFDNLAKNFSFIFLEDKNDDKRILKQMKIIKKILKNQKFKFITINLGRKNLYYKIISNIYLADCVTFYLAKIYYKNPLDTPTIEKIKKLLK